MLKHFNSVSYSYSFSSWNLKVSNLMVFKDCLKKSIKKLIFTSQCFFATDPSLVDLVSLLSMSCYQTQHQKEQTTEPKKKPDVFIFMFKDMFALYWIASLADGKIYPVCIV